jgi:hypothetical protein
MVAGRIEQMKLTLRDLLWLTLFAAIAFAWYRSDHQRAAQLREAETRQDKMIAEWKEQTVEILLRYKAASIDPSAFHPELDSQLIALGDDTPIKLLRQAQKSSPPSR